MLCGLTAGVEDTACLAVGVGDLGRFGQVNPRGGHPLGYLLNAQSVKLAAQLGQARIILAVVTDYEGDSCRHLATFVAGWHSASEHESETAGCAGPYDHRSVKRTWYRESVYTVLLRTVSAALGEYRRTALGTLGPMT